MISNKVFPSLTDSFMESISGALTQKDINKANLNALRELVKFVNELKKENRINEQQFTDLIIMICSNFIENEVEERVNKEINERLSAVFD